MKRILRALGAALALASSLAHATQLTPAQLTTENSTNFAPNNKGAITATILQNFHKDVIDSFVPFTAIVGSAPANNFLTGINSTGALLYTQPLFSNLGGTATCSQLPTLTGNVVSTGCSVTIAANAVTYAKIQTEAASTLLGNPTVGAAVPSEISLGATLQFSGTVLQTKAATGDVTWVANAFATTIANNAVTFAKFQQLGTNTVVGNATSGTANGAALSMPSCSTSGSALIWTTNTGWGCNTAIAAATLTGGVTSAQSLISGTSVTYGSYDTAAHSLVGAQGFIATGTVASTTPTATDGMVLDYVTNSGRFSVFAGDGFCWYNGATVALTQLMCLSSTGALSPQDVINLQAGNTTTPPIKFTSGTNVTTPQAGAEEYDGTVFYGTTNASNRGVMPTELFVTLTSSRTFTNNTSAQAIFAGGGGPASGQITLPTGTYFFEMLLSGSAFSSSSHDFNIGYAGTATVGRLLARASYLDTVGSIATFQSSAAAASVTNAGSSTSTTFSYIAWGTFTITVSGTFIPQLTQVTASAAGTMLASSYIRIRQVGSSSATFVGNWN